MTMKKFLHQKLDYGGNRQRLDLNKNLEIEHLPSKFDTDLKFMQHYTPLAFILKTVNVPMFLKRNEG